MSDEQQSARALGRDPSGDIGSRAFFEAMGSEWVSEGIDDGADICASLHKHFANKFTATKVKLLRAKCNDVSMREALRLADVDFSRWAGLIDTLADHLALDFVTPPPHRCENIPSANSTISTCEVKSYGGIRESKYLDKGGDTLSSDLLREGRLWGRTCELRTSLTSSSRSWWRTSTCLVSPQQRSRPSSPGRRRSTGGSRLRKPWAGISWRYSAMHRSATRS